MVGNAKLTPVRVDSRLDLLRRLKKGISNGCLILWVKQESLIRKSEPQSERRTEKEQRRNESKPAGWVTVATGAGAATGRLAVARRPE